MPSYATQICRLPALHQLEGPFGFKKIALIIIGEEYADCLPYRTKYASTVKTKRYEVRKELGRGEGGEKAKS